MSTQQEPLHRLAIGLSRALTANRHVVRRLPQGPSFETLTAPDELQGNASSLQHDRNLESPKTASGLGRIEVLPEKAQLASRLLPHDGVTLLRAVVCLSIVTLHLQPETVVSWPDSLAFLPAPSWLVQHARLGFESFFVLAGYFLAHSFRPGPWKTFSVAGFYRKRLVRLLLPYWAILFISWLGLVLGSLRRHQTFDYPITAFWKQMLCLHDLNTDRLVSVQLWFMAPLIQFYMFWGIVFWSVRQIYLRSNQPNYHPLSVHWMSMLTISAFIVSIFSADFFGAGFTLLVNMHYLALGCLIYWYSHSQLAWWVITFALSQEIALGCAGGTSRPIAAAVGGLLLMCGAGCTFSAGPRLKWLMLVGRCSYSIYLTHMFVGPRVMTLLGGRWNFYGESVTLWFTGIVSSVLGGYLYYRAIELPLGAWAQGIHYRQ